MTRVDQRVSVFSIAQSTNALRDAPKQSIAVNLAKCPTTEWFPFFASGRAAYRPLYRLGRSQNYCMDCGRELSRQWVTALISRANRSSADYSAVE